MGIFTLDLDDSPGSPPSVRSFESSMKSMSEPVIDVAVPINIKRPDAAAKGRLAKPITISGSIGQMNYSAEGSTKPMPLPYGNHKGRGGMLVHEHARSASEETIDCEHQYPRSDHVGLSRGALADEASNWDYEKPVVGIEDYEFEASGPPVTVGVEWEFLINPESSPYGNMDVIPETGNPAPVVTRPGAIDNLPQVYHVAKALNEANIRAATGSEVQYAFVNLAYAAARFPDVDHQKVKNERFKDYFIVRVDASVRDDGLKMEAEKWKSVEIASAVVTPTRLVEIEKAFQVILDTFHVKTNDSYGLHVHVGNANLGFSNQWMRSAAALIWASAPLFDTFHPVCRGPCSAHVRSVRYFSEAATDSQTLTVDGGDKDPGDDPVPDLFETAPGATVAYHIPGVRPNRPDVAYDFGPQALDPLSRPQQMGVREIPPIQAYLERDGLCPQCPADPHMPWRGVVRFLKSPSPRNTLSMMRNATTLGGRLNCNFDNLRHQANDNSIRPRTIEFRQHAGTTDVYEITNWTIVCAAIVTFARPIQDLSLSSAMNTLDESECADNSTLVNNPKVAELATKAIKGSLYQTNYDVYNFMVDIGALGPFHYYLRGYPVYGTSGIAQASGLLIAVRDGNRRPAQHHRREQEADQDEGAIPRRLRQAGRAVQDFTQDVTNGVTENTVEVFRAMTSCFK